VQFEEPPPIAALESDFEFIFLLDCWISLFHLVSSPFLISLIPLQDSTTDCGTLIRFRIHFPVGLLDKSFPSFFVSFSRLITPNTRQHHRLRHLNPYPTFIFLFDCWISLFHSVSSPFLISLIPLQDSTTDCGT
jgi:hypothetical protein